LLFVDVGGIVAVVVVVVEGDVVVVDVVVVLVEGSVDVVEVVVVVVVVLVGVGTKVTGRYLRDARN